MEVTDGGGWRQGRKDGVARQNPPLSPSTPAPWRSQKGEREREGRREKEAQQVRRRRLGCEGSVRRSIAEAEWGVLGRRNNKGNNMNGSRRTK